MMAPGLAGRGAVREKALSDLLAWLQSLARQSGFQEHLNGCTKKNWPLSHEQASSLTATLPIFRCARSPGCVGFVQNT